MSHPWIWLNEPQHSGAIQAVTGIISTCAAIAAGIFAALAYLAAKQQANEAHAQTELAKQAAADERERLLVEKREERARLVAAYNEKAAHEDATRAIFKPGGFTSTTECRFAIQNIGGTGATDVNVIGDDGLVMASFPFVGPGGSISAVLNVAKFATEGYIITFRSAFGTDWKIRLFGGPTSNYFEKVISSERPYALGPE